MTSPCRRTDSSCNVEAYPRPDVAIPPSAPTGPTTATMCSARFAADPYAFGRSTALAARAARQHLLDGLDLGGRVAEAAVSSDRSRQFDYPGGDAIKRAARASTSGGMSRLPPPARKSGTRAACPGGQCGQDPFGV